MCWTKAPTSLLSTWIRRAVLPPLAVAASIVVISGVAASAHEDPHIRIEKLTRQIEQDPKNAELYRKRAELHRVSSHWELALADFDRAAELSPELEAIDFDRGRLMFEAGWFHRAKDTLDDFLEAHPGHGLGLTIRGRILRELDRPLDAARDYAGAIAVASNPGPGLFVERARALGEAGGEQVDVAIDFLDKAMVRLGPLVVLESAAIDLEVQRQNYDAALERVDRILSRRARKERWLVRRAEILQDAGREREAREAYRAALAAVESLPPHLRDIPASLALKTRLRALLASSPTHLTAPAGETSSSK